MEETTLEERIIELEYLAKAIQNIAWWIKDNGYPNEEQFFIIMDHLTSPDCYGYMDNLDKSKLKERQWKTYMKAS